MTTAVPLYLMYPGIIEMLFSTVSCFKTVGLDDASEVLGTTKEEYRLKMLPSIICYEGRHTWYMWFVAVPGILIWVFIFPLVVFWKMQSEDC